MNPFLAKIKKLEERINGLLEQFKTFDLEIKELKSKPTDRATILLKEKEIKEIRIKLVDCENDKTTISQSLDDKVKELEKSNLSNEEKQSRIISLLTENKNELNQVCQKLLSVWKDYGDLRDKIIELLESNLKTKQEAIKRLENSKQNQFIIVVFLLIVLLLLSLSFSILLPKKKK